MMESAIEGIAKAIWQSITQDDSIRADIGILPIVAPALIAAASPIVAGAVGGAVSGAMKAREEKR